MGKIALSIADLVETELKKEAETAGYTNFSQFCEEILRLGLQQWKMRDPK